MLGGIEAGGTKFVLGIGPSPRQITARHVIETRDPAATLSEASAWFAQAGQIAALGIASFGPVELDRASPEWGRITTTPKPGWADCDIAGHFARTLQVPIGFDTDVNAAALAEYAALEDAAPPSLAYLTIGTGIGGGLVIGGEPVHGIAHPEMGHIIPRRHPDDRVFAGICPHHGDCLEGLASGPAVKARWGHSLSDLPNDHLAHGIIADYIAQACHTLFAMVATERVVLGGGVMGTPGLLDRVRAKVLTLDAGYLPGRSRHIVTAPVLGGAAGLVGALMLAEAAL